jgi:hypothetical protein
MWHVHPAREFTGETPVPPSHRKRLIIFQELAIDLAAVVFGK